MVWLTLEGLVSPGLALGLQRAWVWLTFKQTPGDSPGLTPGKPGVNFGLGLGQGLPRASPRLTLGLLPKG